MPRFTPNSFTQAVAKTLADKGFNGTAATLLRIVGEGKATPGGGTMAFTEQEQSGIAAKVIEVNITLPYRMWEATIRLLNGLGNDDPIPDVLEYQVKVFDQTDTPRPLGTPRMLHSIEVLEKVVQNLRRMDPDSDPEPDSGPPRLGPGGGKPRKPNPNAYKAELARLRKRASEAQSESSQDQQPITGLGRTSL